jgi:hypothetical protein
MKIRPAGGWGGELFIADGHPWRYLSLFAVLRTLEYCLRVEGNNCSLMQLHVRCLACVAMRVVLAGLAGRQTGRRFTRTCAELWSVMGAVYRAYQPNWSSQEPVRLLRHICWKDLHAHTHTHTCARARPEKKTDKRSPSTGLQVSLPPRISTGFRFVVSVSECDAVLRRNV